MAKIAQIQPQGTVTLKSGDFFKFQITLDDGKEGEVLTKSEDRWKVGDEVEAELTATQYGNRLKLSKPDTGNFSGGYSKGGMSPEKEKRITFLSCLSSAASFHAQSSVTPEQVIKTAKMFANAAYSLESQSTLANAPKQAAPKEQPPMSAYTENDNDLPF